LSKIFPCMIHVSSRAITWNGINWLFLKFEDNIFRIETCTSTGFLACVEPVLVLLYRLPRRSLQTRIVMRDIVDARRGERDYISIFYQTYCIIFEIYYYFFVSPKWARCAQTGLGIICENNGKNEAATLKN